MRRPGPRRRKARALESARSHARADAYFESMDIEWLAAPPDAYFLAALDAADRSDNLQPW